MGRGFNYDPTLKTLTIGQRRVKDHCKAKANYCLYCGTTTYNKLFCCIAHHREFKRKHKLGIGAIPEDLITKQRSKYESNND
jgi:hypothetical protein